MFNYRNKIKAIPNEFTKNILLFFFLLENASSVLNLWENELKIVYRTRGTLEVLNKIRTNSVVMIIGNSGSGKTTAMKYASLQLQEEGYEIVLISSPSDIPSHRNNDRNQLFIIDDILGKYRVDINAFEAWKRLQDRISVVFKHSGAKLLVTLRRQLYQTISHISSSTFFESKVVDLDSKNLALSGDEKIGMLEHYLDNRNLSNSISMDEKVEICACNIAFPLLCNIFSSSQDFFQQKAIFFLSPSVVFKEELGRLEKENKEVYCVLVLLMIFSDEELESIFDIECNIDRTNIYLLILRACGVIENIPRKSLHEYLQSLCGTFVEPTNHFRFVHDTLEETLANHFGSKYPDVMIKSCKLEFIRDRVRINMLPTDDENVLVLKFSSFNVLSERILKEIRNGKFRDVILSEPMQDRKFIDHFISYATKRNISVGQLGNLSCMENVLSSQTDLANGVRRTTLAKRFSLFEILQSKKKCFIHWIAAMGSLPLFETFFGRQKSKLRQAYENHTVVADLLHLAILGENIEVAELLIINRGNLNSYDEYGITLLCKTAGTNRCDIAELLIDHGADVNQPDDVMGWTPCFVASWFNEVEMLKLLISKGADVNVMDPFGKMPLSVAVLKNHEQIVSVLLNYGAQIYDEFVVFNLRLASPSNYTFVLGIALANKNQRIVDLLTAFLKSRNTITVAIPTLAENSIMIPKMLDIFINEIKREKSTSALWNDFLAASESVRGNDSSKLVHLFDKSHTIIRYSVSRGKLIIDGNRKKILATFNQNYLRFSLLHIAAVCDNVNAAKLLTKYGANPLQKDSLGRTSLHLANSSAMLEVLLSTKSTREVSSKVSRRMDIRYYLTFKFIPALFKSFACSSADTNINITDNKGNTPLHSILIRISDIDRCLDAAETLVNKGAATDIRCSRGNLPIDIFRAGSLKFDERVEERGERLLGGNVTDCYIKKEKQFLAISICVITLFYILIYTKNATNMCIETKSNKEWIRVKWYVSYTQIIIILIMHWVFEILNFILHIGTLRGFEVKPIRSMLHSEHMLVTFLRNMSVFVIIFRGFCNLLNQSFPTDVFFNIYCTFLCFYFLVIDYPNPIRSMFRKYHFLRISAIKIITVFYLIFWILCFMIFYEQSKEDINRGTDKDDDSWIYLIYIIALKIVLFFLYEALLVCRLISPLLKILFNPCLWHLFDCANAMLFFIKLFFVIDILSVPITMVWCSFSQ